MTEFHLDPFKFLVSCMLAFSDCVTRTLEIEQSHVDVICNNCAFQNVVCEKGLLYYYVLFSLPNIKTIKTDVKQSF